MATCIKIIALDFALLAEKVRRRSLCILYCGMIGTYYLRLYVLYQIICSSRKFVPHEHTAYYDL